MRYWIAVASREHVLIGKQEGIMQVCHGKLNPLKKIKQNDWIIYYSPKEIFGEDEPCRKFTAIGRISKGDPYQYKMTDDFIPWRRDVEYIQSQDALIEPLINKLSFIQNKNKWGYIFKFGIFEINFDDFQLIANAMGIKK